MAADAALEARPVAGGADARRPRRPRRRPRPRPPRRPTPRAGADGRPRTRRRPPEPPPPASPSHRLSFRRARPPPVARSLVPARAAARDRGGRTLRIGMSQPTTTDEGWWLALVWVTDDDGVVSFVDLAPAGGPRPEPPLARLGPAAVRRAERDDPRGRRPAVDPPRDRRARRRPDPSLARARRDPGRLPLGADASGGDAPERARGDGPGGVPAIRRRPGPAVGA